MRVVRARKGFLRSSIDHPACSLKVLEPTKRKQRIENNDGGPRPSLVVAVVAVVDGGGGQEPARQRRRDADVARLRTRPPHRLPRHLQHVLERPALPQTLSTVASAGPMDQTRR